jgi:hypothetical protein
MVIRAAGSTFVNWGLIGVRHQFSYRLLPLVAARELRDALPGRPALEERLGLRVADRVLAWRVGAALRVVLTDVLLRVDLVLGGARLTRFGALRVTFAGLLRFIVTLRLLVALRVAVAVFRVVVVR